MGTSDPDLYRVIYVSAASAHLSDQSLRDLLELARANNSVDGISGVLFYADGDFMQLLEGPRDKVRATFTRIDRDPRHRGVIVLVSGPVEERQFPDWSMGYSTAGASSVRSMQSVLETSTDAGVRVLHDFASRNGLR